MSPSAASRPRSSRPSTTIEAPDTGANLDKQQQVGVGVDRCLLAQAEEIRVVVHGNRHAVKIMYVIGNRVVVPARHADRAGDTTGLVVHRSWHTNPNAAQGGSITARLSE